MKALMCGIFGLAMIAVSGCAVNQPPTVLNTVRPTREAKRSPGAGYLIVYTAIEEPKINPDTLFYPHTAYAIYDDRGTFLRGVRNHIGAWDEAPYLVPLPPGKYRVQAESEIDGEVTVPVVIQGAKTTVVNLERRDHNSQGS
jgi:hypothetical protein